MNVSRPQILSRGWRHRCPNCGAGTLFEPGRYFAVRPVCPRCGMARNKDEAAFLGSATLNYGVTTFGAVIPSVVVAYFNGVPAAGIIAIAGAGATLLPLALYRPSKSWWFMVYYLTFPKHLPANWETRPSQELPPDE